MNLAWKELRRRPGKFAVAVLTLTVLAALLLFIAGLLDGLFLGTTGAIRVQNADIFVYSNASRDSFLRSTITSSTRTEIESVAGVAATGGLGVTLLGAAVPGESALADVAVIGYELAPHGIPVPPKPGQAYADERLKGFGVGLGDTLEVGPQRNAITVIGFVSGSNFLLQGGLWVEPGTWRLVQNSNRPDAPVAASDFQVMLVQAKPGHDAAALADGIDASTKATSSLTKAEAQNSLPGTKEQRSTFNSILATTYLVVVVIVALFFALLTLERVALYGMLKAIGASSRQLFFGVLLQAVVIATVAFAIAGALVAALSAAAPAQLPLQIQSSRVVTSYLILTFCSAAGSLLSLRRVSRIDPAQAVGSAQ
ncbi:MAG: ABC transporter permease [Actinomycetota bacterium]|jgi:putative ABC transport system permease protein